MTTPKGRRVLVVEDEYLLADELARVLAGAGATVLGPVATVRAALDLIAAEAEIACALLDINLRGEKSYAVADALRERGVPFIFITGYALPAVDERYAAVPRCEKPLDVGQVLGLLRQFASLD